MNGLKLPDRKTCLIALIALLFTILIAPGKSESGEKVAFYHDILLEGVFGDGSGFKIQIDTKPFDGTKPCRNWYYIGTDGADPGIIIENISVNIRGNTIKIPEILTCDLADIHIQNGVWIMDENETKLLYLRGGDAAGSYTAIFSIEGGSITSRTIRTRDENGKINDVVLELGSSGNIIEKGKF